MNGFFVVGMSAEVVLLFIGIAGMLHIIRKQPTDPPYNVLVPTLFFGGIVLTLVGLFQH